MCSLFLVELKPSHPSMKEGKLQRPERQQVFPHTIQLKYDGNFVCVHVCVGVCVHVYVGVCVGGLVRLDCAERLDGFIHRVTLKMQPGHKRHDTGGPVCVCVCKLQIWI